MSGFIWSPYSSSCITVDQCYADGTMRASRTSVANQCVCHDSYEYDGTACVYKCESDTEDLFYDPYTGECIPHCVGFKRGYDESLICSCDHGYTYDAALDKCRRICFHAHEYQDLNG